MKTSNNKLQQKRFFKVNDIDSAVTLQLFSNSAKGDQNIIKIKISNKRYGSKNKVLNPLNAA